jgi:hypothetical protein
MSFLLLALKPYFLAMLPIILIEGVHLAKSSSHLLLRNPQIMNQINTMLDQQMPIVTGRSDWPRLSTPARWQIVEGSISLLAATCEVWQGLFLLVELILPSRSVLGTGILSTHLISYIYHYFLLYNV